MSSEMSKKVIVSNFKRGKTFQVIENHEFDETITTITADIEKLGSVGAGADGLAIVDNKIYLTLKDAIISKGVDLPRITGDSGVAENAIDGLCIEDNKLYLTSEGKIVSDGVDLPEVNTDIIENQVNGLHVEGNKLYLTSDGEIVSSGVTLPTSSSGGTLPDNVELVDGLLIEDNKLYLTSDGEVVSNGVTLPTSSGGGSGLPDDVDLVDGLVILDNMLYLTSGGTIASTGVELPAGGGGGGGSSTAITLTNLLEGNTITAAHGTSVNVSFSYASSEDSGPGTAYIYVDTLLKGTAPIIQGDNTIDIGPYVTEGTNIVKITCQDIYSNNRSLSYTVESVSLKITSPFDDSIFHGTSTPFKYIPYGAVEKTIHFVLNGEEVDTNVTSAYGKQITKYFTDLTHGTYTLLVYMTATVNGIDIRSNELPYQIMVVEDGNTTPLITSSCATTTVTQGELVTIPFLVYDAAALTCDITLNIKQGDEVYATYERNVDRTRQLWNTRNYPIGEVVFEIVYGDIVKTHTVTVAKSEIDIELATNDLELNLTSANRSNNEHDPAVWTHGDVTTTFTNVSWVDTGWVTDEAGDSVLRLYGDAKAEVAFTPFANDSRQYGRTIELDFAVRDVNNRSAVVMSCMDNGIGFSVGADSAALFSEQSTIDCFYKDNERIRVSFVIEANSDYRLLSVYLNGVLSGTVQYPTTDNFQQSTPTTISIGSPYCTVDVYNIRSYTTALTHDDIKNNFIYSVTDMGEKLALYAENEIYDSFGNLSFSKLLNKIPIMVVTGDMPTFKGDKKNVTVEFTDPFNPALNFYDTATIDVQGTSSQWSTRLPY